jgi:hypothetical protein
MKNATDHAGNATWPTRSEAAEPLRTRDMPLLFQLADVNRWPVAPSVATPAAVIPPGPGPLEMPLLPGSPAAAASPLASSALDSWSRSPAGLFEMPAGFSTSALSLGAPAAATAPKSPGQASPQSPPEPKSSDLPPANVELAAKPSLEATVAEKTTAEPDPISAATGAMPKAIDTAVKAAVVSSPASDANAKPAATAEPAATLAATATPAANETGAPESAITATDKPSPGSLRRQRADVRQQKVQKVVGQNRDWLQSHGKFIAIGFVLALIATIYIARRNQPSIESLPTSEPPMGLAIEMPGENNAHKHDTHEHKSDEAANVAPRASRPPLLRLNYTRR